VDKEKALPLNWKRFVGCDGGAEFTIDLFALGARG
jgi:hypothetical protein